MKSLKIVDLTFYHFKKVRFLVSANQCMGLSGPSGSGKSLLLRAIVDLDPNVGGVFLGDRERRSMSPPQWRTSVGLLQAEPLWWHPTVGEHFQGTPEQRLKKLGFEADVMQWNISRLSTGEKQRLSMIRLLENEPEALLLDEPTASLDPKNIGSFESLVLEYQQEKSIPILWVSHDPEQLNRVTHQQLIIRDQKIMEAK